YHLGAKYVGHQSHHKVYCLRLRILFHAMLRRTRRVIWLWRCSVARELQIPRKLHMIWVGNDNRMPRDGIESRRTAHPDWTFRLWTDRELYSHGWQNAAHIATFVRERKWPAVADLMRYEILHREGGVYVDADSHCLR